MWILALKAFGLNFWNKISFLFQPPLLYWTLGIALAVGVYQYHRHEVKVAYEQGYAQGHNDEKVAEEKARKAELARNSEIAAKQSIDQARVVASLQEQLKTAEAKKAQVITVTKEVTKYVSKDADLRAPIPAGFVFLHDLSLATDPDSVARSKPADVDAPTAVKLSDIARVDAENNAECVLRGKIIDSWIEWYERNQKNWEAAVKAQQQPVKLE
jgi:hypothetical protein